MLDNLSDKYPDLLRHMVSRTSCARMISTADGRFLWVNPAYANLLGYTQSQCVRMGWRELSAHDEGMDDDTLEAQRLQVGEIDTYTVKKSYLTNLSKTVTGMLRVDRYPITGGEEVLCLCTFTPISQESEAVVQGVLDQMRKEVQGIKAAITGSVEQTALRRLLVSFADVVEQYPRAALLVLVLALGLSPDGLIMGWLARLGYIPAAPVKIDKQDLKDIEQAAVAVQRQALLANSLQRLRAIPTYMVAAPAPVKRQDKQPQLVGIMQWAAQIEKRPQVVTEEGEDG